MFLRGPDLRLGVVRPAGAAPFGGHATLTTSLVSYWPMNETSGTRVDVHGTNDLTDNNTVASAAGIISTAASFTAADLDYLSVADNVNTVWGEDGNGASAAFWVFPTGNPTAYGMLFGRDAGTSQFACYTDFNVIPTAWIECVAGTNKYTSFLTGFLVNNWYHLVIWFDPADKKMRCSINDTTVATTAAAANAALDTTTSAVTFSKRTTGAYQGRTDEAGVWGKVLSSTERTALYNSGAGLAY